jgi:6-pyruvoyltetrahydropterin/6-carboxytetrahydropterin synthase
MPQVRLVRRYRFSSAHRLDTPLLSPQENRDAFGKCNNPYGHGHNYVLEVFLACRVEPEQGRALSVALLDRFVQDSVLRDLNHRNLNVDVPEFHALVPTTENLAAVIAARLAAAWTLAFPGVPAQVEKVRIWETKNNIFEEVAPATGLGDAANSRSRDAAAPQRKVHTS